MSAAVPGLAGGAAPSRLAFCVLETRGDCEIGVRLAMASLRRHYRDHDVVVFWPRATDDFRHWADALGRIRLVVEVPFELSSWNVKAQALGHILVDLGYEQAMWIDSDMLAARPVPELLAPHSLNEVLIAQEPESQQHQGSLSRVQGWGLEPGKGFDYSINTSLLRVTHAHLPLLQRWMEMLNDPTYRAWQKRPLWERPVAYMGGQDAFQALLGSKEFEHLPVRLLRSGRDVVHCGGALGYAFKDRVWGLTHEPVPFVHAIGTKPWRALTAQWLVRNPKRSDRLRQLLQETSPYVLEARKLRDVVGMAMPWLDYRTLPGTLMRLVSFERPCLQGWPVSAAATVAARLGKTRL